MVSDPIKTLHICSAIHTAEKIDPFEGLNLEQITVPQKPLPNEPPEGLFALNPLDRLNLADIALDIEALTSKPEKEVSQTSFQYADQDRFADIDIEKIAVNIHSLSPFMVAGDVSQSLLEKNLTQLNSIDPEAMAVDIHALSPDQNDGDLQQSTEIDLESIAVDIHSLALKYDNTALQTPLDKEFDQLTEIDLEGIAIDIHALAPIKNDETLQQSTEIDLESIAVDINSLAPTQYDDTALQTPLDKEFDQLTEIDLEGIAVDIHALAPTKSDAILQQSTEIDLESIVADIHSLAPTQYDDTALQTPLNKELNQLAEIDLEGVAVDIHLLSSTGGEESCQQLPQIENRDQLNEIDLQAMAVDIDAMLQGQYDENEKQDTETASEKMLIEYTGEVNRTLSPEKDSDFFQDYDQHEEQSENSELFLSTDISHPPVVQGNIFIDALIEKASHYMEIAQLQEKVTESLNKSSGNTLLITGPHDGMGSSVLAAALAVNSSSAHGKKVLLIDCNMRKPDLHSFFFISQSHGFSDLIKNNLPWQSVVKDTGVEGLNIITAGTTGDDLSKHLLYSHIPNLLKEIKPLYDLIIFDTSPVLKPNRNNVNIVSLTSVTDYFLLAITQSGLTKKDLKETQTVIEAGNGKIDSIVINEHAAVTKSRLPFHIPLALAKQAHMKMMGLPAAGIRRVTKNL